MSTLITSTTINRFRIIRRFRLRGVEFPVAEFRLPTRLQGYDNGKVPDDMLVKWVDHQNRACRMAPEFARVWDALVAVAYICTGRRLTFTSPADVYRTYPQQERGWLRRMTLTQLIGRPSRMCKYPNGIERRWWLKPFMAGIACPGHSNHGWFGAAIDHTTDRGRPVEWLKWAAEWFPKFGYSWETPTEDWHVRYCLADDVPGIVLNWEHYLQDGTYSQGSTGDTVREIQQIVGTVVDGNYGPKTATAVMTWKAARIGNYPGIGTDSTWTPQCWMVNDIQNGIYK